MVDILPECRTSRVIGSQPSSMGNMVRLHCASCGAEQGWVTEDKLGAHFAFALCTPCSEEYGDDAHFYKEPDAAFWARCAEAQAQEGVTTPEQIAAKIVEGGNAIATLASDWQRHLRSLT